jgi:predicted porin
MKKPLLTIGVLGVFAVNSHAQGSVTAYGILDEGIQFNTNNKNLVGRTNVGGRALTVDAVNGLSSSRWGLKGVEDLGGGLKTIFTLESGINLNNGAFAQGSTPFGRQALVGVSSVRFGTLTMGRQYDSITAYVAPVSSLGYIGNSALVAHPGDLDNLRGTLRSNNAINYQSPDLGGLTFGAQVSLGGQAGDISAGSGYSVGAAYRNGPVSLAAGYRFFKDPTGEPGSGLFTNNVNGATVLNGALNSGYVTAASYQVVAVGGTYAIGPALIGMTYSNVQYGAIAALGGKTAAFDDVEVGLGLRFMSDFMAGISYNYIKGKSVTTASGSSVGDQHFNQVSLIADYFLSKRTDIYVTGAFQKASGINSNGTAAVADIGALGDSSNNRQAVVRFAMRHRF